MSNDDISKLVAEAITCVAATKHALDMEYQARCSRLKTMDELIRRLADLHKPAPPAPSDEDDGPYYRTIMRVGRTQRNGRVRVTYVRTSDGTCQDTLHSRETLAQELDTASKDATIRIIIL